MHHLYTHYTDAVMHLIWRGEERLSRTGAAGQPVGGGGASFTAEAAAGKQKE